ncbi:MAG: hypothetical protein ACKVS8_10355 [Phycisphaerales bacterium]
MSAGLVYGDIFGQRLWPWATGEVRVEIAAGGAKSTDSAKPESALADLRSVAQKADGTSAPPVARGQGDEIERRWSAARAANPRLRDGDVLSVMAIDAAAGIISAARSSYKRLVAQDETLDLGVRMLGVKGLIVGRDAAGDEHVLIARRGMETRVYGGMWEIAPAGGVQVPPRGVEALGTDALRQTLAEEAAEELGVTLDASGARPVAVVEDAVARSVDVIVRLEWPGVVEPRATVCRAAEEEWEYIDAAWLARRDARAFDAHAAGEIVGPMRVVMRWMGWTGA